VAERRRRRRGEYCPYHRLSQVIRKPPPSLIGPSRSARSGVGVRVHVRLIDERGVCSARLGRVSLVEDCLAAAASVKRWIAWLRVCGLQSGAGYCGEADRKPFGLRSRARRTVSTSRQHRFGDGAGVCGAPSDLYAVVEGPSVAPPQRPGTAFGLSSGSRRTLSSWVL
jgi:hypothetical protein